MSIVMLTVTLGELANVGTFLVTLGMLFVVFKGLRALHHARSANFVSAYDRLFNILQNDNVVGGRTLLRIIRGGPDGGIYDQSQWPELFRQKRDDYRYDQWYQSIEKACKKEGTSDLDDNELRHRMNKFMIDAFRAMDLAAILAVHSSIPGLLNVVVAEWQDGIINCWEQGHRFLKRRLEEERREQYECFSVLYVLAKDRECRGRGIYPYFEPGLWGRRERSLKVWAKAAKKERQRILEPGPPGASQPTPLLSKARGTFWFFKKGKEG